MKLEIKDRVVSEAGVRGTIVLLLAGDRYKVLWDTDWQTGRTRTHKGHELTALRE